MKKDNIAKIYFKDNYRFADLFNFYIYKGEKRIKPENLKNLDSSLNIVLDKLGSIGHLSRQRDLYKECIINTDGNANYVLLGIENQSIIDYSMPIRCMLYDAISLMSMALEIEKKNRNDKIVVGDDYVSGFLPTDRIKPVITLVIYLGNKPWNGPKTIHQLTGDYDKEIIKLSPNYKMKLIEPRYLSKTSLKMFETEIKYVFEILKCTQNKKKLYDTVHENKDYQSLSKETGMMINTISNLKININEQKGAVNMCKAVDDLYKDGIKKGKKEGLALGKQEEKIENIKTMHKNGATVELISQLLSLDINYVKKVLKVA